MMSKQETLIERLARERGTPVEDIRKLLAGRIEAGVHDSDSERRRNGKRY